MSEAVRTRWLDPRLAVGLAVTAFALWFAFRDVDLGRIASDMADADLLWLLIPSIPAYLLMLWFRALRWRHLATGVAGFEREAAYRATAVGFMANNIFPLRLGEVIRPLLLARECGTPAGVLFGTVIVERVFDALGILALASFLLGTSGARAAGLDPGQVLPILGTIAFVPILGILALRAAPEFWLGIAGRVLHAVLPERFALAIHAFLTQFARGLGALRNPKALFWTFFHTFVLWGVLSWIPFTAGVISLGLDLNGDAPGLGDPWSLVRAGLVLQTFVAAAVAIPSAPGFIGPYHAACRLALVPLGVPKEEALALGTLAHAVFWVVLTAAGLWALRGRGGLAALRGTGRAPAATGATTPE